MAKCKKCGKEYNENSAGNGRKKQGLCKKCYYEEYGSTLIKFWVAIIAFILVCILIPICVVNCGSSHSNNKPKYKNGVDRYVNDKDFRDFVDENKAYDK